MQRGLNKKEIGEKVYLCELAGCEKTSKIPCRKIADCWVCWRHWPKDEVIEL